MNGTKIRTKTIQFSEHALEALSLNNPYMRKLAQGFKSVENQEAKSMSDTCAKIRKALWDNGNNHVLFDVTTAWDVFICKSHVIDPADNGRTGFYISEYETHFTIQYVQQRKVK